MSRESRVWAGETPFDYMEGKCIDFEGEQTLEALQRAYRVAMNSDVVQGLYDWLREYVNFLDCGGDVPDTFQAMQALAAYERGLKEA